MWTDTRAEWPEQQFMRRVVIVCIAWALSGPYLSDGAPPDDDRRGTTLADVRPFAMAEKFLERCMAGIDGRIVYVSNALAVGTGMLERLLTGEPSAEIDKPIPLLAVARSLHAPCDADDCIDVLALSSDRPSPDVPCH
jgi:hypothetical protein